MYQSHQLYTKLVKPINTFWEPTKFTLSLSLSLSTLTMLSDPFKSHFLFLILSFSLCVSQTLALNSVPEPDASALTYLWPLPSEFTSGNRTLSIDPDLSLAVAGIGGNSAIVRAAFDRYRAIIFKHTSGISIFSRFTGRSSVYDINKLKIIVNSDNEEVKNLVQFEKLLNVLNSLFEFESVFLFDCLCSASTWCGRELYFVCFEE